MSAWNSRLSRCIDSCSCRYWRLNVWACCWRTRVASIRSPPDAVPAAVPSLAGSGVTGPEVAGGAAGVATLDSAERGGLAMPAAPVDKPGPTVVAAGAAAGMLERSAPARTAPPGR